ncbi:enoyl-CoA delta isomerase 2 [Planococcus citri]|uniref:enoyl-CoA delta isomerase 2 n=1 Tax=Planococcus citri TaxID=170843 RepID=UPI0031F9920C
MTYKSIETSLEDGILTITMNRPKCKNAMNQEMWLELTQVMEEAAINDDVVFVVLTGAGTFYSSGFDIKDPAPESMNMEEFMEYRIKIGRKYIDVLIDFPKLLIAIVNGPAIGIATTTLALFDFVFCTTSASFYTPFSVLGLSVEGCSSYLFPRIMGNATANNVLQFGQKLDSDQAKNCNLVVDVFEPEQIQSVLWPKLKSMKETLSKGSILANKKLIRGWDREILHKVNEAEWDELRNRFASEDFMTSVLKFMNRSKSANKL